MAMFTGTLYPNDPTKIDGESPAHHVSLTPQRLNESNSTKQQRGNDEYYSTLFDNSTENNDADGGRFKVRVVISKANEGVTATKFYHGLFDFASRQMADTNNNNSGGGITEEMVQQNDTLQKLKQHVLDARIANEENNNDGNNGGKDPPILGYEVTIMLCEPHIQNEDIVIPPPSYLDKCDVNFKPVPCPKSEEDVAMYNERRRRNNSSNNQGGIFTTESNVSQSLQFVSPGPWEKANLDAFELFALDVKKALVRVEFPIFPEGCREKTFREVYQLNARVS
jgi:hypothetical protein